MPDSQKEKLVELLNNSFAEQYEKRGLLTAPHTATDLIAHGVTVQAEAKLYWKPVKPGEWNLICSACDSHLGCKDNANFCFCHNDLHLYKNDILNFTLYFII